MQKMQQVCSKWEDSYTLVLSFMLLLCIFYRNSFRIFFLFDYVHSAQRAMTDLEVTNWSKVLDYSHEGLEWKYYHILH